MNQRDSCLHRNDKIKRRNDSIVNVMPIVFLPSVLLALKQSRIDHF